MSQSKIQPDTVITLRDANNNVGFVFPYRMAVEYRNLRMEVLPRYQGLIATLEQENAFKDSTITNLAQENAEFKNIIKNNQVDIEELRTTLKNTDATLQEQIRKVNRFKFLTYTLGLTTLILGGVVIGSAAL
ncbi:MAG: hypothetical protein HUU32_21785 [Calditrichaceae bacterium]|nr:hypothetical protein [Calditrichia bacterium]NUQ44028.1 hypothetical protein [Calditrichaceae bacterium]